jgi:hypothetical protein
MTDGTSVRAEFERYLGRLAQVARDADDVIGLVGMGSTADLARVDEWSDHDFAWMVTDVAAADRYRYDLSWLPDADRIALSVVEHHGGVKVIYDDGRVLEFGIATIESFRHWAGNSVAVYVDKGGVADAVAELLARPLPEGPVDLARAMRLLMTQLLIGVGRARRGEVLTAGLNIRAEAVGHLLVACGTVLPGDVARLDTLEPRRRFEFVHPGLASRVEAAVRLSPEDAARALLDLAEEQLGAHPEFPHEGAAAIRNRLGWS